MEEIIENERDLFEHFRFEIDRGQSLMRVDKFLANKMENYSRNKIQQAAETGNLFANGLPIRSNYKIKPLDVITIELDYPKYELTIIPEQIDITIVYEDEHLLVINKNPGMVVHPGCGNYRGTLVNAIAGYLGESIEFDNADPRPGLVHRIDKDTSGLLVVAKHEQAKSGLAKQFFNKTTQRTYRAVVWGIPKDPTGTISGYIGRHPKNRKMMTIFPDEQNGKWSVTHYKTIEDIGYVSVVECNLETGRTHQIRTHFKHIGYPIFNDDTYAGNTIQKGTISGAYSKFVHDCFSLCPRQALHAKSLGFTHPITGASMQFDSELPQDMNLLIDAWRTYISGRNYE